MTTARGLSACVVAAALLLTGCGNISRSDAEKILNGTGRGFACAPRLKFLPDGFDQARKAGLIPERQGLAALQMTQKVADAPDGDFWQIEMEFMMGVFLGRGKDGRMCIPGTATVTSIADVPFAPSSGSYKLVDFTEVITLPPELEKFRQYVYLQYAKRVVMQKTDGGWRPMN
jgi:hypothetical protein